MSIQELKNAIAKYRLALREHRDQIGDYRCWVDDEVLYSKTLPELKHQKTVLPDRENFHQRCVWYFEKRQAPDEPDNLEIPLDSRIAPLELNYDAQLLNSDLDQFSLQELEAEAEKIMTAIRVHKQLGYEQRTYQSDRALYLKLPEKTVAITRLPPRDLFLGRGCPDYNSHCQRNPEDFERGIWFRETKADPLG